MSTASIHESLSMPPANLVGGAWRELPGSGIGAVVSTNPADPSQVVWAGVPNEEDLDLAVQAAREALPVWSAFDVDRRIAVLKRFAAIADERVDQMAALICDETGKPMWDSMGEAKLLSAKVGITVDNSTNSGRARVTGYDVPLGETKTGRAHFRPHGVLAVVGPFNFPAHLPNGHIIPALLTGNTVVFKPSDKTPAVGQLLAMWMHEALEAEGAPAGVVNLVQGATQISRWLVTHRGVDGVLFTGSWPVGRSILEANLDHPGRIVALELGGNNPAVVLPDADLRQAAIEVARCAFITTGQRCTCTRRLIVQRDVADRVIGMVTRAARALTIGHPRSETPVFMGPIVAEAARDAVFEFQQTVADAGGEVLLESTPAPGQPEGWYLTPSIIQVDRFAIDDAVSEPGCDREIFGPLLRVSVVDSEDDAFEQANATRYGLAASVFTKDQRAIDRFLREGRAGCLNINTGTAGASGKLPFGGLGHSGNHRPAGAFSLDYCAYPVASMIETGDAAAISPGMRFDDEWAAD